jgi:hypothetical protein
MLPRALAVVAMADTKKSLGLRGKRRRARVGEEATSFWARVAWMGLKVAGRSGVEQWMAEPGGGGDAHAARDRIRKETNRWVVTRGCEADEWTWGVGGCRLLLGWPFWARPKSTLPFPIYSNIFKGT